MGLASEIKRAIAGHGHGCTCDACMAERNGRDRYGFDRVILWRLCVAAALFVAGLATKNAAPTVSLVLAILSLLVAGYDVLLRAVGGCVRDRVPDESFLMSVAAIVSVLIGRGLEGALVMLLVQAGSLMRGYAVEKVRRSIDSMADARTEEAAAVLRRVRSGMGEKGRTEEFLTHFARLYTPAVLGIAVVLAVVLPLFFHTTVSEGIYKALVLLVIACPCALVISVPLGYYAGIGGASRQGVLFCSSAAMEDCCQVDTVVFDQAGALQGEGLRVISVKSDRMDADVMLRIAAHACAYAEGDFADSIKAAYQGSIYIELIESFRQEDRGIAVEVDNVSILLGSEDFMREHGVDPGLDVLPESCVYLTIDGQYAGRILFGPVAKSDAGRTVQMLSWDNGRQLLMVSGESASAAEKFARSVGISQYYAECTPERRAAVIRDLREKKTKRGALLFVGSADADEESLREAEIGAAMNGAGSDAALGAADIVLMGDEPSTVATALEAAKHTRSIVMQNIIAAMAFKLIVLGLDIAGLCPLWLAVFADSGVALAAILNCLRALVIRPATLPEVG